MRTTRGTHSSLFSPSLSPECGVRWGTGHIRSDRPFAKRGIHRALIELVLKASSSFSLGSIARTIEPSVLTIARHVGMLWTHIHSATSAVDWSSQQVTSITRRHRSVTCAPLYGLAVPLSIEFEVHLQSTFHF
jgi:hypothetical protein